MPLNIDMAAILFPKQGHNYSQGSRTLKILEQTLRPQNFKSVAMATVAPGYPPKPNQL